jgi:aminopeptidase N/puromycin-sensitive aminopeptidase
MTVGSACHPWVFVNAGARGYFRTAYSTDILRALATNVDTLTAPERSSLADDEWALVSAGRHSVADFLTLASGFGRERTAGVLAQITSRLEFIHNSLASDADRPRVAAWARALLRPLSLELGVSTPPGDPDDRRALRSTVIGALGSMGADADVVAAARAAVDRALANPANPAAQLDPTTASAVILVAARRGDRALYEALVAAAARANAPEERYRYLYALTVFEDPALLQRALEYSLSPDLRRQDAHIYLARFLSNPAVNARAWDFVKQHWTELQPKLTAFNGEVRVANALGSFCTPQARDDVKAFFAKHKLTGAARTVDQTIERMNNCIALREKQAPILSAWLDRL